MKEKIEKDQLNQIRRNDGGIIHQSDHKAGLSNGGSPVL